MSEEDGHIETIDVNQADCTSQLPSDAHKNYIQDNFSWTYDLPAIRGHITFYKTLFYCSVCEESISCDDCDLILTALNHLVTMHQEDIHLEKKTCQGSDFTASDGKADSEEVEEVSDDSSTSEDESLYLEDDDLLKACLNEELEKNKHEVMFHECTECGEKFEMGVDDFLTKTQLHYISHNNKNCDSNEKPQVKDGKTENNLQQMKEEITETNEPGDLFFVCIECGENIKMVGENFEIKVQMHFESHFFKS